MPGSIDWAAPVVPGRAMLGLTLGTSLDAVRALFDESGNVVGFPGSPNLIVDCRKEDAILLRAADLVQCKYDWQNIVARLVFERGELTSIVVLGDPGNEAYAYQGKLFGSIGLGSHISELLAFGPIDYDDAEEVFVSSQWNGIEIGGAGACDLAVNPNQLVTFLKVHMGG